MSRDILDLHAERQPDKPAVVEDRPDGTRLQLSFAELDREVNRIAQALRARGLGPGDRVVWCGPNSIGVVALTSAARKLGVTAVPLNYRLAAEEAAYVVDHCDAVLVYADAQYAPLMAEVRPQIPKVRDVLIFGGEPGPGMLSAEALLAEASDEPPPPAGEGVMPSTMIYTSGTTGKPKGAFRRGLGDPAQVRGLVKTIGYVPDDVFLTTGPLYHSGPGGFALLAQMLGNTVVLQRHFDAEDWLRLVDRYRVTTTFAAPTPIRRVCKLPPEVAGRYDVGSMKRMVANAAPWSMALKELYLERFPKDSLWEVYGSTELGVSAILEPKDQLRKPGSCGKLAPTVEMALFDDDGRRIREPNVPGELFVKSATVFDSYHKAEDKYEEDRRGEFHTVGDIAYFDDEGYFFICDRKKDMIISGGANIYPAEVEAVLERHPQVDDVAVFGIPSEEWGESVHAVVVVQSGSALTEAELVEFAREHLARYKVPRSVSFADDIPRTGSGKILKRVLREPFWQGQSRSVS